ncbi:glycoside hydrolase [Auriculariales sp. MPI-PUGE-AT-0066]|nr:glycoside hydrolase [Auriculariales sp. MPI-PUGE-AT-0066]
MWPSVPCVAFLVSSVVAGSARPKPVVSGYWANWESAQLSPKDTPYDVLSHIDWFVAATTDSYQLDLGGPQMETDLKNLIQRAHKKKKTVSMAVGGWTGSRYFSTLVANATGRLAYANSMKSYVKKFGFDGIDLDWEFPASQGIGCNAIDVQHDSDNFLEFIKTLRKVIPTARLSAAVSVSGVKGPDGATYNRTGELGKYLDYATIMAYDVYGPWSATTGPLGPLYSACATSEGQGASGADALKIFTSKGFPARKLLLGLPTYSRPIYTTSSVLTVRTVNGISSKFYQDVDKTRGVPPGGAASGPGGPNVCGDIEGPSSSWTFKELISSGKLTANGTTSIAPWQRYYDQCSASSFLFEPQSKTFIAYDDPTSFKAKAAFVKARGMGGINMFDLAGDTRNSLLIKAARKGLVTQVRAAVVD